MEVHPHPELVRVTRRQFFNRSIVGMAGLGAAAFGGSVLAFLWPRATGSFGRSISVGSIDRVLEIIRDTRQPLYVPAGRFYLVPRDDSVDALYQRCTHLGCRVPFCTTSQWFECGCHASKYNLAGEWKAGPAPRGLDRFPVSVEHGAVTVNTGVLLAGPPRGTDSTGQEAAGPHCVDGGH